MMGKLLPIIGLIISLLASAFFGFCLLLIVPYASREGAGESFLLYGFGTLVSVTALVACVALLRKPKGFK